jgi:S-DNA-T family DNA segregation ATPase FtsK/SpoIIIE
MALMPRHRRELLAIVALLVGVFFGLALLPTDVTGPAGRVAGRVLWKGFGAGAALLPVLGLTVALAGFGRLPGLDLRRATILFSGLVFLVPFAIAIALQVRSTVDLPPSYDEWTLQQRLVGLIPALLAIGATSAVGTAGAVIAGLVALSALTLVTVDWHPFRHLSVDVRQGHGQAGQQAEVAEPFAGPEDWRVDLPGEDGEKEEGPPVPPPRKRRAGTPGRSNAAPTAVVGGEADELPPIDLLESPPKETIDAGEAEIERMGEMLIQTLATFKVEGKVVGRTTGPVVTQFEVAPAPGVKVGRIAALADDLALTMRAQSIRIVAPIPGKAAVGVEVPNPTPRMVTLRELIEGADWDRTRASLPIALGRDLEGKTVIADLAKMPHLLIAGATGSGKSVCINTIITSLIYRYTPRELKMLMIDPKMVELSAYNTLPHLRHAVVTNNKQAAQLLKWAVHEMERRYELFHANSVRNVGEFNRKLSEGKEMIEKLPPKPSLADEVDQSQMALSIPVRYSGPTLPYLVIIVDELADLMMTVQGEVETPLALLAQKARATGIHIILATQRPSVNVITGLIKANFSSRIAFRVASKVDSRTILDQNGAEALLGNGDMLFLPPGRSEPVRLQGGFIGTDETERVTGWYGARKMAHESTLRAQGLAIPETREEDPIEWAQAQEASERSAESDASLGSPDERDGLFREAAETCIQHQLGSTSLLQRKLRIGYGRAARIIDQLHEAGILGPPDGSKPREVLIGIGQLDEYCD